MDRLSDLPTPDALAGVRLPAWWLPADWPRHQGQVVAADLRLRDGRIETLSPQPDPEGPARMLALPPLVQAHAHLDKAFTAHRARASGPGLLPAIQAAIDDRTHWNEADLRSRMQRGLRDSWDAGVAVLRTHIDWIDAGAPLAWSVAAELAQEWRDRIRLERVALVPLRFFADAADAKKIAGRVASSDGGTVLGGFVHTSNWSPAALHHLLNAAQLQSLDLDLHIDEELHPQARGLSTVASWMSESAFEGRVVCSHACALAAQPAAQALHTLDALARQARIALICLPSTNLLLQDARTGHTPLQRGLTLVHEARARGIAVLIGSDNVQDPFCHHGALDPLHAFELGVFAAQLSDPFDQWTDSVCRADWLGRTDTPIRIAPGARADLLCFAQADALTWPVPGTEKRMLRGGLWQTSSAPRNP